MSFELIAPGTGGNAQAQPNGNTFSRGNPAVRLRDLVDVIGDLGERSSWRQLTESGPEHLHAPVHVPPKKPKTVLKEYNLAHLTIGQVLGEAR